MGNLVSSNRSSMQRLFYDRPAATWLEALPLGNGRIGAMRFSGIGRDRIGLLLEARVRRRAVDELVEGLLGMSQRLGRAGLQAGFAAARRVRAFGAIRQEHPINFSTSS